MITFDKVQVADIKRKEEVRLGLFVMSYVDIQMLWFIYISPWRLNVLGEVDLKLLVRKLF